jgi:putative salt-induced outer membrane protein
LYACHRSASQFFFEENAMSNRIPLAFLVVPTLLLSALADQVTLKNGDHLTGTITKSDGKTLVLKTDYAGEITLKLDAVDQIHSDLPLHVDFTNGQAAVGTVNASDNQVTVATANNGPVTNQTSNISILRNADEEAAYEKSLHPSLTRGWAGGANIGFGLTGGNSETESLNLAFNADRKTTNDDTTLYTNAVYATNNEPGASPSTTANTVQGGIRYSHNLTPRVFAFVAADFQTDELQELNLRGIYGGGLGYHLIKGNRTTLDLYGGVNYTHEDYTTMTNSFAALTLGEELTYKLGASTVISEKGYYFPDLEDTSQYRATFNLGTITKISKWLGWQNAFGDIYVTNPPVDTKKNDIIFTTGINIAFTH